MHPLEMMIRMFQERYAVAPEKFFLRYVAELPISDPYNNAGQFSWHHPSKSHARIRVDEVGFTLQVEMHHSGLEDKFEALDMFSGFPHDRAVRWHTMPVISYGENPFQDSYARFWRENGRLRCAYLPDADDNGEWDRAFFHLRNPSGTSRTHLVDSASPLDTLAWQINTLVAAATQITKRRSNNY